MARRSKQRPAPSRSTPPGVEERDTPVPARRAWDEKGFWWKAALLIALGWAVFQPALHGTWLWDDDVEVSDNPLLRSGGGLWHLWTAAPLSDYWPLTWTTLWVEWHLWTDHPLGYHAVTLALHLASGLLLWRLLDRLGLRWGWLGGILFVVHPLAVESVAWISEIKNTLSLPFFLLSCLAWLDAEEGRRGGYLRSVLFYLAAMLSKTSTVMLPAVLLLYGWWKRGRIAPRELKRMIPYLLVALVLGSVTLYLQSVPTVNEDGKVILGTSLPLLGAEEAVLFYLGKFVVPLRLLPIYPPWQNDQPPFLAGVIALAGLLLLVGLWTQRQAWGRHVLFGFGFFLLNLLPVLGLLKMTYMNVSWVADHLVYLPMVGLIGLATAALETLAGRLWPRARWIAVAGAGTLVVVLAWQSRGDARRFADSRALWTYGVAGNPGSYVAHNSLGIALKKAGLLPAAMEQYREAMQIDDGSPEAHYNMGTALLLMNRIPEAVRELEISERADPGYADTHDSLGSALVREGRLAEAEEQCDAYLRLRPGDVRMLGNRGYVEFQQDQFESALADFNRSLALDPGLPVAYFYRAAIRQIQGELAPALSDLRRFVELAPRDSSADYARLWIWLVLAQQGHKDDADRELSHDLAAAWNAAPGAWVSENARFLLGQLDEVAYLAAAVSPDKNIDLGQHGEAFYYLGMKQMIAGNPGAAADDFRKCLATRKSDYVEYKLARARLAAHALNPSAGTLSR
jgi:tetratricopeptide (TPR) repeat protein